MAPESELLRAGMEGVGDLLEDVLQEVVVVENVGAIDALEGLESPRKEAQECR